MTKSLKCILVLLAGFLLAFSFSFQANAQTIYKKDPGFFTPVLKSFSSDPMSFILEPAVGYRFGRHFDLALSSLLMFSKKRFVNNRGLSFMNIGLMLGYTTSLSNRWQLRSQLAFYKMFHINSDVHVVGPSSSELASLAFYYEIPVSGLVSFYPNAGFLIGYSQGSLSSSPQLARNLRGFVSGGRLGFDILFKFSSNFYFTISPCVRFERLNKADRYMDWQLLSFKFNF
jgi:hypothetical protein